MELYPDLTERFPGMTISSETRDSDILLPELKKNTYQLIVTMHPIETPDMICQEFRTEQLYLTVPPAHPLASRHDGIYLEELAGETMLLYKEIGVWSNLIETKMSQTKFIIQDQDEAFVSLIQASALPAFATNLTLDNGDRRQNRTIIPILDPEATITFYCCVQKSNKAYLPDARSLRVMLSLTGIQPTDLCHLTFFKFKIKNVNLCFFQDFPCTGHIAIGLMQQIKVNMIHAQLRQ